jgi:hypothetical protein
VVKFQCSDRILRVNLGFLESRFSLYHTLLTIVISTKANLLVFLAWHVQRFLCVINSPPDVLLKNSLHFLVRGASCYFKLGWQNSDFISGVFHVFQVKLILVIYSCSLFSLITGLYF